MKTSEKMLKIGRVLKERFPNLTAEETMLLAAKIIDVLEGQA